MKVNYHVLPQSLVVNFDGQTHNVMKGDSKYSQVLNLIKKNELDKIPAVFDLKQYAPNVPGLELKNNELWLDGEQLPEVLAGRVMAFKEQQLPFEYLLKFARKLKLNTSYNSRLMLFKFLEHNGHPITQNGNFIAYRGVTNDFKDLHTGKFDNTVGSICEVPRDSVDDNPNNTCSSGLHVACHSYAKGFGPVVIEVEVDPQDVVCVPTDYNGTKMRVCKFTVVNVCKQELNQELYGAEKIDYDSEDLSLEWEAGNWRKLNLKPSTAVIEAYYNADTQQLDVELDNGDLYSYFEVPEDQAKAWEKAPSVGSFYCNYIAHEYLFTKE